MAAIVPVGYRPPASDYVFGVEVIDASTLRARIAAVPGRGFERVDFPSLLFVVSGRYDHVVDFETHELAAGSCLVISPGQVHRFGDSPRWQGWMMILSPHRSPAALGELPTHVRLTEALAVGAHEQLQRMHDDARLALDPARVDRLLALEADAVIGRVALGAASLGPGPVDGAVRARYRAYRDAVDRDFRSHHQVAAYTRELGCSAKSLNRACRAEAGISAKQLIVDRVVLEARRMLAHDDDTVAAIGRRLGFDEATNFVKFFRREAGTTPGDFRAAVRAGADRPPGSRNRPDVPMCS